VALRPERLEPLQQALQFRPRWNVDPVPWWIFERLDERVILDLARVQLQFQHDVLAAELKANEAGQKALGGIR
jgi:hypothetical protein